MPEQLLNTYLALFLNGYSAIFISVRSPNGTTSTNISGHKSRTSIITGTLFALCVIHAYDAQFYGRPSAKDDIRGILCL